MKNVKKIITLGLIVSSLTMLPVVVTNASWRQNADTTWSFDNINNGWLKDGINWYYFKNGIMQTGWLKDTDGKWYYLSSNGEMLTNTTTPDGYKVDINGVFIQNTISSNNVTDSTNVSNTSNSSSVSNNVTINNLSQKEKDYYSEVKKYYEKQLSQAKQELENAKQELSNVETTDQTKMNAAKIRVKNAENIVQYNERMIKRNTVQ